MRNSTMDLQKLELVKSDSSHTYKGVKVSDSYQGGIDLKGEFDQEDLFSPNYIDETTAFSPVGPMLVDDSNIAY